MSLLDWLLGNEQESSQLVRRTIYDEKNGEYEFVGTDDDYQEVLGDQLHKVVEEQPYEEPRRKLFGIF